MFRSRPSSGLDVGCAALMAVMIGLGAAVCHAQGGPADNPDPRNRAVSPAENSPAPPFYAGGSGYSNFGPAWPPYPDGVSGFRWAFYPPPLQYRRNFARSASRFYNHYLPFGGSYDPFYFYAGRARLVDPYGITPDDPFGFARDKHLLDRYSQYMADALQHFKSGNYPEAARLFMLAARTNQGDPASRIHAAHTMIALGRYSQAMPFLRRAYQLQPNMVLLSTDIRHDYGNAADFEKHLAALRQEAEKTANNPDLWFLLGYAYFYSGSPELSYDVLIKAQRTNGRDALLDALLSAARLYHPEKED